MKNCNQLEKISMRTDNIKRNERAYKLLTGNQITKNNNNEKCLFFLSSIQWEKQRVNPTSKSTPDYGSH